MRQKEDEKLSSSSDYKNWRVVVCWREESKGQGEQCNEGGKRGERKKEQKRGLSSEKTQGHYTYLEAVTSPCAMVKMVV